MRKRERQARQRAYSKKNREKRNLSGEMRYEVWIPKENADKLIVEESPARLLEILIRRDAPGSTVP